MHRVTNRAVHQARTSAIEALAPRALVGIASCAAALELAEYGGNQEDEQPRSDVAARVVSVVPASDPIRHTQPLSDASEVTRARSVDDELRVGAVAECVTPPLCESSSRRRSVVLTAVVDDPLLSGAVPCQLEPLELFSETREEAAANVEPSEPDLTSLDGPSETEEGRSSPHPSDAALVEAFVAGDSSAFTALWARHSGPLHRYIRSVLRVRVPSEDLLQEAFLALAVHARGIRDARTLRKYLMTVVRRVAFVETRRSRRRAQCELATVTEDSVPPLNHDSRETLRSIQASLARLSTRRRDVFVLCCVDRLTAEEAAKALGISVSTVRRELLAARRLVFRRIASEAPVRSARAIEKRTAGAPIHVEV